MIYLFINKSGYMKHQASIELDQVFNLFLINKDKTVAFNTAQENNCCQETFYKVRYLGKIYFISAQQLTLELLSG